MRLNIAQIAAPDFTGSSSILANATRSLNDGFNAARDGLANNRLRRQEAASNALIPQLAGVRTESEVDGFLDNLQIDPRNMTPELAQSILNLRKGAMGFDTQRLEDAGISARTANTRNNTRIASNVDGRAQTTFDRNITREDQLAALAGDAVRLREGAFQGDFGTTDDEVYFASIKSSESGGDPNAKNPLSTATGLYQFTGSTWDRMVENYPDLGLTKDGRTDPAQQERAIRAFTAENVRTLDRNGIPPTNGNKYAAHFLGAGDAVKVLKASDDTAVSDIVSDQVIDSNPFLRGMTVGEFRGWSSRKGGGESRPRSVADLVPENSLIDPATLLGLADGNFDAFKAGEAQQDANRTRDFNFGNEVTDRQRTEDARVASDEGARLALDASRNALSFDEAVKSVLGGSDNPNVVAAANAALPGFAPDAAFTPSFNPTAQTPAGLENAVPAAALQTAVEQFTAQNNLDLNSNETARINAQAANVGDDPAQYLLESIPNLDATKAQVLDAINEVAAATGKSPAVAAVLLSNNTFNEGFFSLPFDGQRRNGIYTDNQAAIEAGREIFSPQGVRDAAIAESNNRNQNASAQQTLNQISEIDRRIALQQDRGQDVDPALVEARNNLTQGLLEFTSNQPTSGTVQAPATTPVANTPTTQPVAQAAPLAQTPVTTNTESNISNAVNYLESDPQVQSIIQDPNVPPAQKVQAIDSMIQKVQSDRFLPDSQKQTIIQELELVKTVFTG